MKSTRPQEILVQIAKTFSEPV